MSFRNNKCKILDLEQPHPLHQDLAERRRVLGGQSAGHESLAMLIAGSFTVQTGVSPAGASMVIGAGAYSLRGVANGVGLVQPGDEIAAEGLHSSLPAPREVAEKTVAVNCEMRASNWL